MLLAEERAKEAYPSCDTWRHDVVDRLKVDPPEIMALANYAAARLAAEKHPAGAWSGAIDRTVAELPSASRLVIMADTPDFGVTPGMCLAAHVDDVAACEVVKTEALYDSIRSVERTAVVIDWVERSLSSKLLETAPRQPARVAPPAVAEQHVSFHRGRVDRR